MGNTQKLVLSVQEYSLSILSPPERSGPVLHQIPACPELLHLLRIIIMHSLSYFFCVSDIFVYSHSQTSFHSVPSCRCFRLLHLNTLFFVFPHNVNKIKCSYIWVSPWYCAVFIPFRLPSFRIRAAFGFQYNFCFVFRFLGRYHVVLRFAIRDLVIRHMRQGGVIHQLLYSTAPFVQHEITVGNRFCHHGQGGPTTKVHKM